MPLNKDYITDALALIDALDISASDEVLYDLAARLNKTNAGQKQHYQDSWSRVATKFEAARGTPHDLKSLLLKVAGTPSSDGLLSHDVSANPIKINLADFHQTDGHMVVVHDSHYQMRPNDWTDSRLIDAIVGALRDETEAICEIGCGWGRNLASTALATERRDLKFIGLEQSEHGLTCTRELLQKDASIQFKTSDFDFYSADFSELQNFDDIVVFSCAAIEQITFISTSFIEHIMALGSNVTLILYEPIGWQRIKELQKFGVMTTIMEIMGNVPPEKHHIQTYTFDLLDKALLSNAASWSVGGRYNLNLWSVIEDAVARQLVTMPRCEFDISGINPFNPYSLIILEKRK